MENMSIAITEDSMPYILKLSLFSPYTYILFLHYTIGLALYFMSEID